jgi:predicted DNA-binding transcriptional regulator AlpA
VPRTHIEHGPWHLPDLRQGPSFTFPPVTRRQVEPRKHTRILSFGELQSLKHITWNEEHITKLVSADLFPAPIHPGAWRESQIDDWMNARRARLLRS